MEFIFGPMSGTEIALFLAAILAAAAVAGFLAGLFGIGGGAVMVPVFSELFKAIGGADSPWQALAVSTSLAVIVVTGIQSARTHYAVRDKETGERVMHVETLKKYLIFVPLGVVVGLLILGNSGQGTLTLIFGFTALAIGIYTLAFREVPTVSASGPKTPVAQIGGFFIGAISLLMGVGGGVLNNLFMTLLGSPLKRAIATSAGVGVLIAVPGAIGAMIVGWGAEGLPPLSLGYVNLVVFAAAIPVTSWMAPIGARLTHSLPSNVVKTAFGIFLILTALRAIQKVLFPF